MGSPLPSSAATTSREHPLPFPKERPCVPIITGHVNAIYLVRSELQAVQTAKYLQSLASPDTLHPFAVHMPPRITQQHRHPAVAMTAILPRKRNDIRGQSCFAIRRSALSEHAAELPVGHPHHRSAMIDAAPPARGYQKFLRAASCRISLSSVRPDIARCSRRFSFSRSFIRRAGSVFRPLYSLRQR